MKPFEVNRHGRLIFPANFHMEWDFSRFETLAHFNSVIERDISAKAPTATELLARISSGTYSRRFDLLRDLGQNLLWVSRYSITQFEQRPTRWRDLPKQRDDVFLPRVHPWPDREQKISAVERAFHSLPSDGDSEAETKAFALLFDVFRTKLHSGAELPAVNPTVAEFQKEPSALTLVIPVHDPDFPAFCNEDILDVHEEVPELEALMRWAMVLHNQYPWDRAGTVLRGPDQIDDDDFVVALHPRNRDVSAFIDRVKGASSASREGKGTATSNRARPIQMVSPVSPYQPVQVRDAFVIQPVLEALAVVRGEHVFENDDVLRNASLAWSPMSAEEITAKTGITQRRYTSRDPEELALTAALAALNKSGRKPEEIGAVLVTTSSSTRLIPPMACRLSAELGLIQTHASVDLIAACAGLPYGLAEAIRQVQEVQRPVLLVCVEKFSDKIGSARPARMIFGDAAAAIIVAPAQSGQPGDVEVIQTYGSGPSHEVNSIIGPNPAFDGDLTMYGPDVKSLVRRYLLQMVAELRAQTDPDNPGSSMLDSIELVVPHQANKAMFLDLAEEIGLPTDHLYFNIEKIGNVSSASIPIAIHDAIRDGVITRPTRVFAPAFGAGAVGGYAVMRIDPAIVADEVVLDILPPH